MEKYVIKDNLPEGIIKAYSIVRFGRTNAVKRFMTIFKLLNASGYNTKMTFRNQKQKPLRGTIQVEIDGFYFYVELYKVNE